MFSCFRAWRKCAIFLQRLRLGNERSHRHNDRLAHTRGDAGSAADLFADTDLRFLGRHRQHGRYLEQQRGVRLRLLHSGHQRLPDLAAAQRTGAAGVQAILAGCCRHSDRRRFFLSGSDCHHLHAGPVRVDPLPAGGGLCADGLERVQVGRRAVAAALFRGAAAAVRLQQSLRQTPADLLGDRRRGDPDVRIKWGQSKFGLKMANVCQGN